MMGRTLTGPRADPSALVRDRRVVGKRKHLAFREKKWQTPASPILANRRRSHVRVAACSASLGSSSQTGVP